MGVCWEHGEDLMKGDLRHWDALMLQKSGNCDILVYMEHVCCHEKVED